MEITTLRSLCWQHIKHAINNNKNTSLGVGPLVIISIHFVSGILFVQNAPNIQLDQFLIFNAFYHLYVLFDLINILTLTDRLKHLSLDSLELRRLRFDLHTVFKIAHNLIDLPINNFFVNSITSTRHSEFKFFKPRCETSSRSNFFSLRIINCWNNLPEEIISATSFYIFRKLLTTANLTDYLSGYIS